MPGLPHAEDLEHTILAYVAACPGACDTLDGICDWWIPRQQLIQARAEVLAALERLQERGAIESRMGVDGQSRYAAPDSTDMPPAPQP